MRKSNFFIGLSNFTAHRSCGRPSRQSQKVARRAARPGAVRRASHLTWRAASCRPETSATYAGLLDALCRLKEAKIVAPSWKPRLHGRQNACRNRPHAELDNRLNF